jgi:putative pyruvate formate lyase activating enzyme
MNQSLTDQLEKCECCPRRCGVNRLEDETGYCGVGSGIEISHAGLHFGEEPPISGTRGSGTIFLAGVISAACFARITRSARSFSRAAPGL